MDLCDIDFLFELSSGGRVGMKLAELRDGSAVDNRTRRTSRMILICLFEAKVGDFESFKQRLDVALEIEKGISTSGTVHARRNRITGSAKAEHLRFFRRFFRRRVEDMTHLEEPDICGSAIQVPGHHPQHSWN